MDVGAVWTALNIAGAFAFWRGTADDEWKQMLSSRIPGDRSIPVVATNTKGTPPMDIRRMNNDAIVAAVQAGTVSLAAALHETTLRQKTGKKLASRLKALGVTVSDETEANSIASDIAERKAIAKAYFAKAFAAAPEGSKLKAGKTAYRTVMTAASVDAAKRAGRRSVAKAKADA